MHLAWGFLCQGLIHGMVIFSSGSGPFTCHRRSIPSELGGAGWMVGRSMYDDPRGARHRAPTSRRDLAFGGPLWIRTMKQPYASVAKLRGGEPILLGGMKAMVQPGPRHDHPFTAPFGVLGARTVPARQRAFLLEQEEAPGELDHAMAHPRVSGLGEAL